MADSMVSKIKSILSAALKQGRVYRGDWWGHLDDDGIFGLSDNFCRALFSALQKGASLKLVPNETVTVKETVIFSSAAGPFNLYKYQTFPNKHISRYVCYCIGEVVLNRKTSEKKDMYEKTIQKKKIITDWEVLILLNRGKYEVWVRHPDLKKKLGFLLTTPVME